MEMIKELTAAISKQEKENEENWCNACDLLKRVVKECGTTDWFDDNDRPFVAANYDGYSCYCGVQSVELKDKNLIVKGFRDDEDFADYDALELNINYISSSGLTEIAKQVIYKKEEDDFSDEMSKNE